MSSGACVTAIILAAGRSSRMGMSKPLLPLGPFSVIERVVRSVFQAGIDDIVVVTGHGSAQLAPLLDGLGARMIPNPDWELGMFSSVRTGVTALGEDIEAFFILPVDCPLVGPRVLARLLQSFRNGEGGILYPACCGQRGHPPLISGRYKDALLRASNGDNLRSFLQRNPDDETAVDVEDITILMDMDTAEDHQRISRFARTIDGAERAAEAEHTALTIEDALYLLSLLEVPDRVVRHCRAVAVVGEILAEALKAYTPNLDVALVRTACLLHDMAKTEPRHAIAAQNMLSNLGLRRLGSIVGSHMVLPSEKLETPLVTEEQLVYLADKLVVEDEVGNLEERTAHALGERTQDPGALEGVRRRMRMAEIIREKVECILERPLGEVLGEVLSDATRPLGP
jgi:molybdenum cofactor cytidylyltransferase